MGMCVHRYCDVVMWGDRAWVIAVIKCSDRDKDGGFGQTFDLP